MLILRLLTVDGRPPPQPAERGIESGPFSLGRGAENDWVLADPGRVLSKQHCVLEKRGGVWEVQDTSTNGVFHNGAPETIGRGRSVPLADGDRLQVGRYLFQVMVPPAVQDPLSRFDALFDEPRKPASASFGVSPPPPPLSPPADPWAGIGRREATGRPADAPPLPDWGGDAGEDDLLGSRTPRWSGESFDNERLSSDLDSFRPPKPAAAAIPDDFDLEPSAPVPPAPEPLPQPSAAPTAAKSLIPDDWDDLLGRPDAADPAPQPASQPVLLPEEAEPVPAAVVRPAAPERVPDPEPIRPPVPAPAASPPPAVPPRPQPAPGREEEAERLLRAFLEGAGLETINRGDRSAEDTMREAGRIVRESVGGLAEILASRDMVKAEFRLARTMFQAERNNPLKLSPTVEEKVARVLGVPDRGYMAGLPAVHEAVNDISAHEMALLAGLKVALDALIAKFDPERLKQRLDTSSFLGGLFPAARKARYWEVYEALYESIAKDVADDFQRAYGDAVAEAYEARLAELGQ